MTSPEREALIAARSHLITLGGDPRSVIAEFGSPSGDEIQAAVLDIIDKVLSAAPGEPCAWRQRLKDSSSWTFYFSRKPNDGNGLYETEPLYTAPQPAAGWDETQMVADADYLDALEGQLIANDFDMQLERHGSSPSVIADRMRAALRREAPAPAEGVRDGQIEHAARVFAEALDCAASCSPRTCSCRDYARQALEQIDTAEARLREALTPLMKIVNNISWCHDMDGLRVARKQVNAALSPPSGGDEAKESEGGVADISRAEFEEWAHSKERPSEPSPPADRRDEPSGLRTLRHLLAYMPDKDFRLSRRDAKRLLQFIDAILAALAQSEEKK